MEQGSPPSPRTRESMLGSAFAAVKNYFTPERNASSKTTSEGLGITPLARNLAALTLDDSTSDTTDSFKTCYSTPDTNETSEYRLPDRVPFAVSVDEFFSEECRNNPDDSIEETISFSGDEKLEFSEFSGIEPVQSNLLTPIKEVFEGTFCSETSGSPNQTIITTSPLISDKEIPADGDEVKVEISKAVNETILIEDEAKLENGNDEKNTSVASEPEPVHAEQPHNIVNESLCAAASVILALSHSDHDSSLIEIPPQDTSNFSNSVKGLKSDLDTSKMESSVIQQQQEKNNSSVEIPEQGPANTTFSGAFEAFLSNSLAEKSKIDPEENMETDSLDGNQEVNAIAAEDNPTEHVEDVVTVPEALEADACGEAFEKPDETITTETNSNLTMDFKNSEGFIQPTDELPVTDTFATALETVLSQDCPEQDRDDLGKNFEMVSGPVVNELGTVFSENLDEIPVERMEDHVESMDDGLDSSLCAEATAELNQTTEVPWLPQIDVEVAGVDGEQGGNLEGDGNLGLPLSVPQVTFDESPAEMVQESEICGKLDQTVSLGTESDAEGSSYKILDLSISGPGIQEQAFPALQISPEENVDQDPEKNSETNGTPLPECTAPPTTPIENPTENPENSSGAPMNLNNTTVDALPPGRENHLLDSSLLPSESNEHPAPLFQHLPEEENVDEEQGKNLETNRTPEPEYTVPPTTIESPTEKPEKSSPPEAPVNLNNTTVDLLPPEHENHLLDSSLLPSESNEPPAPLFQHLPEEEEIDTELVQNSQTDSPVDNTTVQPSPVSGVFLDETPAEKPEPSSCAESTVNNLNETTELPPKPVAEVPERGNLTFTTSESNEKSNKEIDQEHVVNSDAVVLGEISNAGDFSVPVSVEPVFVDESPAEKPEPSSCSEFTVNSLNDTIELPPKPVAEVPERGNLTFTTSESNEKSDKEIVQSNQEQVVDAVVLGEISNAGDFSVPVSVEPVLVDESPAEKSEIVETTVSLNQPTAQPSDNMEENNEPRSDENSPEENHRPLQEEEFTEINNLTETLQETFLTPIQETNEPSSSSEFSISPNPIIAPSISKQSNYSTDSPTNDLIIPKGRIMVESTPQPSTIPRKIANNNNMSDVSPITVCLPEEQKSGTDSPYTDGFLDDAMLQSTPEVTDKSPALDETKILPNPFDATKILEKGFDETRVLFKNPVMDATVTLEQDLAKAVDKANMNVTRILMNDEMSFIGSPFSCKNIQSPVKGLVDFTDEPRENMNQPTGNKIKNPASGVLKEITDNIIAENAWFGNEKLNPKNQVFSAVNFDMFNTEKSQTAINRESLYINFDPCYQPKLDKTTLNAAASEDLLGLEVSSETNEEKLKKEIHRLRALYEEREQEAQLKLKEIQEKTEGLEKQYSEAQTTLDEIEQRNSKMQRQIQNLGKSNVQLAYASETYQKAVEKLRVDLNERLLMERPGNPAALVAERDSYQQHLKSAEAAFIDVLAKFEKMKKVSEDMKKSTVKREKEFGDLKRECVRLDDLLRVGENSMKASLEDLQRKSRDEQEQYHLDAARITAQLRKSELSLKNIQDNYDKTVAENEKIAALCDDIIAGKSLS